VLHADGGVKATLAMTDQFEVRTICAAKTEGNAFSAVHAVERLIEMISLLGMQSSSFTCPVAAHHGLNLGHTAFQP